MDIYLVFNELSAVDGRSQPEATIYTARQWMADLVDVITTARRQGILALKCYRDFFETELVSEYTVQHWLRDSDVDRDQQRRIRSAGSAYTTLKPPARSEDLSSLPEAIQQAEARALAFTFRDGQNRDASGLGSAYLLDSIAVSLNCHAHWEQTEISLIIEQFDEEADEIFRETATIRHVSQMLHMDVHRGWSQERFTTSVSDGRYLLSKCDDWYPHLIFVDAVKRQIEEMNFGTPQLRQAVKKLFELQTYCADWIEGGFDKDRLPSKASPESASVGNDKRLRAMRTFTLSNGADVYCEWHLRLTPDAWRLHFSPDAEHRRIIVCYIGKKLPTKKYRTI